MAGAGVERARTREDVIVALALRWRRRAHPHLRRYRQREERAAEHPWAILEKVIETASGEAYADFVVKHVLAKGMTRTRYGSHDAIIPGRAHGYEIDARGDWVNARYFSAMLGYSAGGFLSTPADMATWYGALSRGEIISEKMLSLAMTEGRGSGGEPTGYGLGWYVSEFGGDSIAHHGGSTFGFQCYIYWVPARGIFVGVFKNSSDQRGEPKDDARALLAAVIGQ